MQEIEDIRTLAGNERFIALAEANEKILSLHEEWMELKRKKEDRLPRWELLEKFQEHAKSLPESEEFNIQIKAINNSRSLLSDPDPIKPIMDELTKHLRKEILQLFGQLENIYDTEMSDLENLKIWRALNEDQKQLLVEQERLSPPEKPDIRTEKDLLKELNEHPLLTWQNQITALPVRFERAKIAAAKLIEPKVVQISPRTATIRSKSDLNNYLDALRAEIEPILEDGNPVVITRNKKE
jgi:hypothetical protein